MLLRKAGRVARRIWECAGILSICCVKKGGEKEEVVVLSQGQCLGDREDEEFEGWWD